MNGLFWKRYSRQLSENVDKLRFAYKILTRLELGRENDWEGPRDELELAERISFIALSSGIIGYSQSSAPNLLDVIVAWHKELFGKQDKCTRRELRNIAHSISNINVSGGDSSDARLEQILDSLGIKTSLPISTASHQSSEDFKRDAEILATGIAKWLALLEEDDWTTLPLVHSMGLTTKLKEAYVDLYAVRKDEISRSDFFAPSKEYFESKTAAAIYPSMNAISMMPARTKRQAVVVGEAGSGKTTLVKRIAQAVKEGEIQDFDLAIAIQLRSYAYSLERQSQLSLLEGFFYSIFDDLQSASSAARNLRCRAER